MAVCPLAHPFFQMEPAAEAACASLLSEPLWSREALPAPCRDGADFCWPARGHAHRVTLGTVFVVCRVWFLEGHLKALIEEISEGGIVPIKTLPGPPGSSLG